LTTEYVFDWLKDDINEEGKENDNSVAPKEEMNLIDITPKGNYSSKHGTNQFTFVKDGELNSHNKNTKLNKVPTEKSKKSGKSQDASFSESGNGSGNSSDEESEKDKKKKTNEFNLLGKSSSEKSEKPKENFNIDDEIVFKNESHKSSNFDADIILNVKK
jgi:hypothetical protein